MQLKRAANAGPAWRAVYALALGVFGLIVAEFLPASLLTPMAASLGVSEGMAGQAVTATALVALVTGLLITPPPKYRSPLGTDVLSVLQIVSSLMVAFASSLEFLLLGRLLLGIAIGGFWSMSTATAMRLVPAALVPKALAVIFSAVSIATVVAAPLGSYLGGLIGWRSVFILCTVPSVLALLWQLWVLPSMRPESVGSFATLFKVLRRPGMVGGMLATILIFSGHFAFSPICGRSSRPSPGQRRRRLPDSAGIRGGELYRDLDRRASVESQPAVDAGAGSSGYERAGADDGDLRSYRAPRWIAGRHVGLRLRSGAGRLVNLAGDDGAG
ncbi:hypothetical protein DMH27_04955 [Raoultella planticola]|nr:hypothetical protein [Raoultella planticola]